MEYTELFNDIRKIIESDYSGFIDKKSKIETDKYVEMIKGVRTDNEFLEVVDNYLHQFKDHHLRVYSTNETVMNYGVRLRRYEDSLYVTDLFGVNDFKVGDRIVKFDGASISELSSKYDNLFYSPLKERQNWRPLLKNFNNCTVIRDNRELIVDLKTHSTTSKAKESNINYLEGIPVITLPDFNNENLIKEIISINREKLNSAPSIIIDVRDNIGGSDLAYFPVIEYLFEDKTSFKSLFENESMEVLYSKQNCDLRIAMFTEITKDPELPDYMREYIEREIELYKEYYGMGFVEVLDDEDYIIEGLGRNKKIYVLTDMYCGSSGDSFVRVAKKSPITTVIGRNTMGVLDYSNCAFYNLDDRFEFMYPTSRMVKDNKVLGIDNVGVEPDMLIEWTPNHIYKDIDLEKALQLID